jgi:hypothetical protein
MKYAKKTILYILLFTSISVGAEVFEQKQLTLETQENKGFYEALGFKESTNNPYATNNEGAIGKYQILQGTLKELGYNWVTLETFREDPSIFPEKMQLQALNKKIQKDLKLLQKQWFRKESINYLSFIADTINGIPITLSGIVAACHIGGVMGTIRWFDSLGKRNPGDTNRSTIGAYMREFSQYNFDLSCLKDYGKELTLSTKQSKSSTTKPQSRDMGTVMISGCLTNLPLIRTHTCPQTGWSTSTLEYKQHYQNITEVYSTSEVPQHLSMGILMLLGLGKLNGTTLELGRESLHLQENIYLPQKKVQDFISSILNRCGMLLGMLRFAICLLHLSL